MIPLESLSISSAVSFSYIDTGKPSNASYTTIFAIPGLGSTAHIFDQIHAIAPAAGIRFVSINRRSYGSTTAYSSDEVSILIKGTEKQKIPCFCLNADMKLPSSSIPSLKSITLPPISPDGRTGGAILIGWSLGNAVSIAAIAYADTLPSNVHSRFSRCIRRLVIHEPPSEVLGFDPPTKHWVPLLDTSLPEELRMPAFNQWITGYFKHSDLSKRDLDSLSYIIPATFRPPTIFNMSEEQVKKNFFSGPATLLDASWINFKAQFLVSFNKAVFDPNVRAKFSRMKVSYFSGDVSPSLGPAVFWKVEDEVKERGDSIHCELIHGFNHFPHWDEPKRTLQVYLNGGEH